MENLKPYDITKLAVGPARVLYAPTSVAVPVKLQDIIKLEAKDDYDPITGWIDFGAAPGGDGASYSRSFESEGLEIEQETSAIFSEITDVNRSFSLNIAEIDEDNMKIVEGTSIASETVAPTASTAGQQRVPIGAVTELEPYRIALIAQRKKQSITVVEADGTERGGLVAIVLNRCTLSADETEIEVAKSNLMKAPVQFEAFPEPGVASEKAYGGWIFEDAANLASGS